MQTIIMNHDKHGSERMTVKLYKQHSAWVVGVNIGHSLASEFVRNGHARVAEAADYLKDTSSVSDEAIAYMNYWQSVAYPAVAMSREEWRASYA